MPAVLSGQAAGTRQIVIDLNDASALAILQNTLTQIGHIFLSGTTGAGDGTIVIRTDSSSGAIIFKYSANVNATRLVQDVPFSHQCAPVARGLFFDALNTAWAAGSTLIIYTE